MPLKLLKLILFLILTIVTVTVTPSHLEIKLIVLHLLFLFDMLIYYELILVQALPLLSKEYLCVLLFLLYRFML